ncbi:hypothetical protein F4775DRAFT_594752 [Biscogniauxia sp. FL1348]|nr:hypothetical protein F4775DRAFT_594752 [Biscogniauxia sp. FL1348]
MDIMRRALGGCRSLPSRVGSVVKSSATSCITYFLSSDVPEPSDLPAQYIEDYRPGYPRYSALVAAHNSFFICRRFNKLRARLLLVKQDRLAVLEEQLESIDSAEECPLFLGSRRDDTNVERGEILHNIDRALADYDEFLHRNNRVLGLPGPNPRDVQSLQNWLNGTSCLSWAECEYLQKHDDLVGVAPANPDSAATRLEAWAEDVLIRHFGGIHKEIKRNLSRDRRVFIFSDATVKRIAKTAVLLLLVGVLAAPLVICSALASTAARIGVIVLFLAAFMLLLARLATARALEMLVAGAT